MAALPEQSQELATPRVATKKKPTLPRFGKGGRYEFAICRSWMRGEGRL